MKPKALVTGGAGFVGGHLVRRLIEEGWVVNVLDDLSTGSCDNLHDDTLFLEGDIRDSALLADSAKDCSVIYHLAARVELQKSIMDPADCFSVNVTGTAKVLMEAMKAPNRRLLFASSCAVYPLEPEGLLSESMSTNGETPYAMSKVTGERMMEFYHREKGLNYCSLRCFNIYGPGQRSDSPYSAVIPTFIAAAKKGKSLMLNGGGMQTRDFIHVADVVDAYLLMSKSVQTGVFNLGSGRETSIREVAEMVALLNSEVVIEDAPAKSGDATASCADLRKIQMACNFVPSMAIDEGLATLSYDVEGTD